MSGPIRCFSLCISLALVLSSVASPLFAQQRGRARTPPATQSKDELSARRAKAISLLVETADRARVFDDLFYRARVQMLAADALWKADEERARLIFRRAWEAARASDRADREEAAREAGLPSDSADAIVTDARDEVMARAAARDPRLADAFLRELTGENNRASNNARNQPSRRTAWHEPSASGQRRLTLAYELVNKGEYSRAAQVAGPVINEGVSADLMAFILRLRERSAADADALYLRLLASMKATVETDANSVLLASALIVSPELLIVIDEQGTLQLRPIARAARKAVASQSVVQNVRDAFYNAAATALLRPQPVRADANVTQSTASRFFAINRLLPFFEREAAQYVAELSARRDALGNEIEAGRRATLTSQLELRRLTPRNETDPLGPQVEQLARAQDQAERDRISLSMITTAARNRLWDRARRTAAAIENSDLRRAAQSFIALSQIADITRTYKEDKENDYEPVVKFVGSADVPPAAAAWGFAQAAEIAARKGDRQRVSEIINEAQARAARVEMGTRQRIAAYAVVTLAAARVEPIRAWEMLPELVKAANASDDYAGDDITLEVEANVNLPVEVSEQFSVTTEAFRLDTVFATMASLDFDRAQTQARELSGEIPQALARIAIARSALETGRATK